MRIYVAAMYSRREEMQKVVAPFLRSRGHEVTSRWIEGDEEGKTLEAGAVLDVEDVDAADALIFFSQPYRSANVGGGRHWEFGYAFARGKRCFVVGDRETIFCHLPGVWMLDSIHDLP